MSMEETIRSEINDSIQTKQMLLGDNETVARIAAAADTIVSALKAGNKIMFAGNGGSFADSQHLAAEFTGRFRRERIPLPALCLGANSSSISAIGNDYGYEQVFARELSALGSSGDVLVAISTSGNSRNLLECVPLAKEKGISVICLTGETGGKLADVGNCIRIPSGHTARIQESHITVGHILCEIAEDALSGN